MEKEGEKEKMKRKGDGEKEKSKKKLDMVKDCLETGRRNCSSEYHHKESESFQSQSHLLLK